MSYHLRNIRRTITVTRANVLTSFFTHHTPQNLLSNTPQCNIQTIPQHLPSNTPQHIHSNTPQPLLSNTSCNSYPYKEIIQVYIPVYKPVHQILAGRKNNCCNIALSLLNMPRAIASGTLQHIARLYDLGSAYICNILLNIVVAGSRLN